MAKLDQEIVVADAPTRSEFKLITPGNYTCLLTEDEEKDNGSVVLKIEVQDGEFAGSKVQDWLNFKGDEQWKIDVAYASIAELAGALGYKTIIDISTLHNKRFTAEIGVTKPNKGGKVFNTIKKYLPYGGSSVTKTETVTVTKTETAAVGNSAAPWKKKA